TPRTSGTAPPNEGSWRHMPGRRSGSESAPSRTSVRAGCGDWSARGLRPGLDRRLRLGGVDVEAGVIAGLVDHDQGAGLVSAEQQVLGEDVLDHVLDDAAQRAGAI